VIGCLRAMGLLGYQIEAAVDGGQHVPRTGLVAFVNVLKNGR
jgi:hypothetical protein